MSRWSLPVRMKAAASRLLDSLVCFFTLEAIDVASVQVHSAQLQILIKLAE